MVAGAFDYAFAVNFVECCHALATAIARYRNEFAVVSLLCRCEFCCVKLPYRLTFSVDLTPFVQILTI